MRGCLIQEIFTNKQKTGEELLRKAVQLPLPLAQRVRLLEQPVGLHADQAGHQQGGSPTLAARSAAGTTLRGQVCAKGAGLKPNGN